MLAIISVLVVVLLSLIVTRVATIALTLTGLSRQSARFQARSALTGAGFTTSESESVVNHPVRRRIIMTLMLLGSAGVVTVIGGLVIGFARNPTDGRGNDLTLLTVLVAGLAALLWLFNIPKVDRALQRVIRRLLIRYTDLDVRDYAGLLHIYGEYTVSELQVGEGDWMADKALADLRLSDEGLLVLGVQRGNEYYGAPKGHTRIMPGDLLVLYGSAERIEDLDRRPAGTAGEQAHEDAIEQQRVIEAEQRVAEARDEQHGAPGS